MFIPRSIKVGLEVTSEALMFMLYYTDKIIITSYVHEKISLESHFTDNNSLLSVMHFS